MNLNNLNILCFPTHLPFPVLFIPAYKSHFPGPEGLSLAFLTVGLLITDFVRFLLPTDFFISPQYL